jgi:hypothetical protein
MSETPETETPETNAQIYERRTICRVGGIQEVVELVDAEVARKLERNRDKWKADFCEVSRQCGNLRFALHKIADAVRYGFRHGTEVEA